MANVNIKFNGKDYLLSCDDGQEESLKKLTSFLDNKYLELKKKLGNIGENKLLLITAIKLIDEHFDLRRRISDQKNKLDGKFQIPSPSRSRAYSFFADFPKDQNGKAVNEWLFLLATKSKFEVLDLESSENFHKRLDELGRENWRIAQIGYTILSE